MNALRSALFATFLVAGVAGCHEPASPPKAASTPQHTTGVGDGAGDGIGDTVGRAMDEARSKLATENITISHDGSPKAEITPKGDLLIDGRTVAINDAQRRLLLDYRAQVVQIASAGMDVGTEGAKLAGKAIGEAIGGLLSGNPDRIEQRVQAQAQGVKNAALKLCDRLPAMYDAQKRVAAAVPEFAPYAKAKPHDIAECRRDVLDEGGTTTAAAPAPTQR